MGQHEIALLLKSVYPTALTSKQLSEQLGVSRHCVCRSLTRLLKMDIITIDYIGIKRKHSDCTYRVPIYKYNRE